MCFFFFPSSFNSNLSINHSEVNPITGLMERLFSKCKYNNIRSHHRTDNYAFINCRAGDGREKKLCVFAQVVIISFFSLRFVHVMFVVNLHINLAEICDETCVSNDLRLEEVKAFSFTTLTNRSSTSINYHSNNTRKT